MALKNTDTNQRIIHYSDRGLQYCFYDYQKLLDKNRILTSMTEQYDPYENTIAERINGVLKQEFDIDKYNVDINTKIEITKNAIEIYNKYRPYLSKQMLTPS